MEPKVKQTNWLVVTGFIIITVIILGIVLTNIFVNNESSKVLTKMNTEQQAMTDQQRAAALGLTLLTQDQASGLAVDTLNSINRLRSQGAVGLLKTDPDLCVISEKMAGQVTRWGDESMLGIIDTASNLFKTVAEEKNIYGKYKTVRLYSVGAISAGMNTDRLATKWLTDTSSPLLSSNSGTNACAVANQNVLILTVAGR